MYILLCSSLEAHMQGATYVVFGTRSSCAYLLCVCVCVCVYAGERE